MEINSDQVIAALRAELAQAQQERDNLKQCGRIAIDAGEVMIATLREERDSFAAALEQCHEGAARQLAEPRNHDDDQFALHAIATVCEQSNYGDILGPRDDRMRREGAAAALDAVERRFSFDRTYYGSDVRQVCEELREGK